MACAWDELFIKKKKMISVRKIRFAGGGDGGGDCANIQNKREINKQTNKQLNK